MEKREIKSRRGKRSKFKSLIIEKDFEPENPKQLEELDEKSCKWPIGHPDEKNFYFCGRTSLKDFSYCKLHLLYAYQPKGKKEDAADKEEIPEFIEKKIQTA
jgi:GcrA cell cycle regulator|tara:strand:- start:67 stop:372 length:306 start_codon:yes stop_codon:yes gene_type:complete